MGKPPSATNMTILPDSINDNLNFFQNQVKKYFPFLATFGFTIDKIETGRSENFLDYYCNFHFKNGDTSISINFSTDIVNGHKTAFPKIEQRPVVDSQISCFISDNNAFMSVDSFAKTMYKELTLDKFTIPIGTSNLQSEITNVIESYSSFFQDKLTDVLKKKKIYNCYTDRFNDKVFNEIIYAD